MPHLQSLVGYEGGDEEGGKLDYLKILDTNTMIWSSPEVAGPVPETRYGNTMTQVGLHLLFHGGWDGTRPLKDIVALQIAELWFDYYFFLQQCVSMKYILGPMPMCALFCTKRKKKKLVVITHVSLHFSLSGEIIRANGGIYMIVYGWYGSVGRFYTSMQFSNLFSNLAQFRNWLLLCYSSSSTLVCALGLAAPVWIHRCMYLTPHTKEVWRMAGEGISRVPTPSDFVNKPIGTSKANQFLNFRNRSIPVGSKSKNVVKYHINKGHNILYAYVSEQTEKTCSSRSNFFHYFLFCSLSK